jgi:Fur family peroxide stress response transcriptional regulator
MRTKKKESAARFNERLATGGFRLTPQREQVYRVLTGTRDHPTAEQVFLRAKRESPEISMATVYNCLDALVTCGLVRQVNLDRAATRYCPNMSDHCHFYCERCGEIYDVSCSSSGMAAGARIPHGFEVKQSELSLRGLCPDCSAKAK